MCYSWDFLSLELRLNLAFPRNCSGPEVGLSEPIPPDIPSVVAPSNYAGISLHRLP